LIQNTSKNLSKFISGGALRPHSGCATATTLAFVTALFRQILFQVPKQSGSADSAI